MNPVAGETGSSPNEYRGPQGTNVCTAEEPPSACDDGPFGKGKGGQLRYSVTVPAGASRTLWVAVAGSDKGQAAARRELQAALSDPAGQFAAKVAGRERWGRFTRLSLPGDQRLAAAVDWGKQNILDLTRVAEDMQIRWTDQGKQFPPPDGSVARARWVGAGFPDYPWMFATDGEYTAFASVAVGQFEAIEDHLRALRDISDILNDRSGVVTHEVDLGRLDLVRQGLAPDRSGHGRGQVRLQHRRDGQVPERGRAPVALDGRQRVPRRHVRLLQAQPALRGGAPRRGRRRLAGGVRQRRAQRHGRREAGQLGVPDPRPVRPRRHGALQERRPHLRVGEESRTEAPRPLRGHVVDGGRAAARRLDRRPAGRRPEQPAAGPALDRRDADGGGADDRGGGRAGPHHERSRQPGPDPSRDRLLQRPAPVQPRPVPHRLHGRLRWAWRAHDLRPQHGDSGGRRGQLRPPRPRPAAALHRRGGRADVRPAVHAGNARRAARRAARDPPVTGLRPTGPARRQHRPLLDLPRDVRAGLGALRDRLAGGSPAARRAARHGPAAA